MSKSQVSACVKQMTKEPSKRKGRSTDRLRSDKNYLRRLRLELSSHPRDVKSWLASSSWSREPSPMTITVIVNEECMSVGDACRDLDEKGVVRGDFLLVGAGLIAGGGLALDLALERHRQRVVKDK